MMIALVLVVLLLTGLPIYVCLGLTSLIFFLTSGTSMHIMIRTLYSGVDQYALIAVTGFLLVASLFEKAGITEALITMVKRFMAAFQSGLAVITIVSCAIFAAVTGSGPATVATIGGIMIPAMIRAKYTAQIRRCGGIKRRCPGHSDTPQQPLSHVRNYCKSVHCCPVCGRHCPWASHGRCPFDNLVDPSEMVSQLLDA